MRVFFLILILLFSVDASSAKKQKRTIKTVQSEQTATKKKISETEKKLNANAARTEKTLQNLNILRGEISRKEQEISSTQASVDSLNRAITSSTDSLTRLNNDLQHMRNTFIRSMRNIQGTQHSTDLLGFIFSSESFTKAHARMRYVKEFAQWRKRKSQEIKQTADTIELRRNHLSTLQSQRTEALNSLNLDQQQLKKQQTENDRLVTKLRADADGLKKALDKERSRLRKIDSEITRMIEAEKAERERQKKSQKNSKAVQDNKKDKKSSGTSASNKQSSTSTQSTATKPKTAIDNSDPDQAMTNKFAAAKGSMPFPVSAPYNIVAKFGSNAGQPYNTGIEILLDGSDNTARSIFDGTVSRIFQNHDGNYSVMVRHGAYITVFYNIARPTVKSGQQIKARSAIGTVAADSRYAKPMLHFEVRRGSETLNPLTWVR